MSDLLERGTLDLLEPRTKLKPESFTAPLYIVVRECKIELTERIEFKPFEDVGHAKIIVTGIGTNVAVFDRVTGGDSLYWLGVSEERQLVTATAGNTSTCSISFRHIRARLPDIVYGHDQ